MSKKAPANNEKTERKPRGRQWVKGQSGNPKGRPKDGESWAAIIKAVGDMYPEDIIAFIGKDNDLGRNLAQMPKQVQMKYLVTSRIFAALMFEPSSGLWKELMERVDGKIVSTVDVTTKGESLTQGIDDTRNEILRKLAGIATATGADKLPEQPE